MKQEDNIESYFDKWARDFNTLSNIIPYYVRWSFKEIAKRIPKDNNYQIADFGTGNGRLIINLNRKNYSFVGLDVSSEQLNLAALNTKEDNINAEFVKTNLEGRIPLEKNSIDYIVSNAAFHHVKNKENLFRSIFEILKSDGSLIFFDFYFDFENKEYEEKIRLLNEKYPSSAKKFKNSIEKEYHLIPFYLKETHPEEFHIDPFELKKLIMYLGFKNCELIPSFDKRYIGFKADKK